MEVFFIIIAIINFLDFLTYLSLFFCLVLLILLILLLIIVFIGFKRYFTTKHVKWEKNLKWPEDTKYMKYKDIIDKYHEAIDNSYHEEIETTSYDNYKLVGDFYPNKKINKVMIFFHGYTSMFRNDFGSFLEYYNRGYSLLCVDQRAHRRSEGKYITFGVKESRDVKSWCDEIVKRLGSDVEIVLGGVSLGASTVLMSADLELPNVKGIIADCGFISCKEIIIDVMRQRHIPFSRLFAFIIGIYCQIFGKFKIEEKTCPKSLSKTNIPILLIHGNNDDFVPYKCSVENFKYVNSEFKDFLTIDANLHGASYFENPKLYIKTILDFLEKINF